MRELLRVIAEVEVSMRPPHGPNEFLLLKPVNPETHRRELPHAAPTAITVTFDDPKLFGRFRDKSLVRVIIEEVESPPKQTKTRSTK